jgi:hypothetical protein
MWGVKLRVANFRGLTPIDYFSYKLTIKQILFIIKVTKLISSLYFRINPYSVKLNFARISY